MPRLALSSLRLDFQPTENLIEEVVAEKMKELMAGESEPIIVRWDGESYFVQDGFHRCEAARRLDMTENRGRGRLRNARRCGQLAADCAAQEAVNTRTDETLSAIPSPPYTRIAMNSPTERQREVLDFIQAQKQETGQAPSYGQIARKIGVRSRYAAWKHVDALRRKGPLEGKRRVQVVDDWC